MIKSIFLKALPYLFLVGIFITGYFGFVHMQEKLDSYAKDNQDLKSRVKSFELENEVLKNDIGKWVKNQSKLETLLKNLQNSQSEAIKERERINEIFQKHDLEKLARKKPSLIEKRFNSGTADIIRMLECTTNPSCPGSNKDP